MESPPLVIDSVLGNALISAAKEGAAGTVRQLLDGGANVNFRDEDTNALNSASANGHIKVVNVLLEKRVQINAYSKRGLAAIHEAASEGHASVVRLLLQGGADINAIADNGATALEIAEEKVNLEVVKLLLESGAGTQSESRLYIAIEFGSRFSSVAYLFEEQEGADPQMIIDWPGLRGFKSPYTPTVIGYDFRGSESFNWGYKVKPESRIKLEGLLHLLDPDQPVPLYVPASNTKKELQKLGKPVVNAASDYLGALCKHALDDINNSYPREFVAMQQKRFVFTIPALWSETAKENLTKAARLAGMYPITLIRDTFASALFALHNMKSLPISVGDAFVFCDIGYTTADLCSFEYTTLGLAPDGLVPQTGIIGHTTTREDLITLVSGCIVGSNILNHRFQEFVKNIVGDDKFREMKKTEGFADAMKTFDREVIPSFPSDPNGSWNINFTLCNLEDDPANNLKANCLCLAYKAVQKIIDPLVTAYGQLVAEQVANVRIKRMAENHPKAREIKAIVLTESHQADGLARASKLAIEKANPGIRVIEFLHRYSSVACGAVLSQLPPEKQLKVRLDPGRISDRMAPE